MAGHSKWKNIQARKGSQDKKRGKIFTKIATEITVAARLHGGDPDSNPRLRTALLKARGANMPKDNIERAIKKGTGNLDGANYVEKTYEGYGPGGVAIICECLTDNVNRTVSEVRLAFTRCGGNLGTDGSVSWMFHKRGQIVYNRTKVKDLDQLMEAAIEHGADDVKDDEDMVEIICEPTQFAALKDALDKLGVEPEVAELTRIPENYTTVGADQSETVTKLVDMLEDSDDVQNVYHNAELL